LSATIVGVQAFVFAYANRGHDDTAGCNPWKPRGHVRRAAVDGC